MKINGKNGKRIAVTAGTLGTIGVGFPVWLLFQFFMGWHTQSIADHEKVRHNAEQIKKVEAMPEQMASVTTDVENIKDDIEKIEKGQSIIESDIKKILQAVQ